MMNWAFVLVLFLHDGSSLEVPGKHKTIAECKAAGLWTMMTYEGVFRKSVCVPTPITDR